MKKLGDLCVIEDRVCTECKECDRCELNPDKLCDNCCNCLELDSDYAEIAIDDILINLDETKGYTGKKSHKN